VLEAEELLGSKDCPQVTGPEAALSMIYYLKARSYELLSVV
jgi:hypothetical protein